MDGEAKGLDSIDFDNIPDDLTASELTKGDADPEEVLKEKPEDNASLEPPEDDGVEGETEPEVVSDDPEKPEPATKAEDEELVEVEWYGRKGKISKELSEYQNKMFTEKHQRQSEEHRLRMEQAKLAEQAAEQKLREAEEYRELLEAHLQENPEFHESWKRAQLKQEPLKRELESMQKRFNDFIEQQQRSQAEQQVKTELSNLAARYQLASDSPLSNQDIEKLALAEVLTSGYAVPLEDAYQRQVAMANASATKSRARRLQSAASNAKRVPAPSKPGNSVPATSQRKVKMSLDQLLEHHLSLPDAAYSNGKAMF